MKDTISAIIPAYNVAAYLRQCLDSVLSQSYSKLQVILIDDGSTDDSGAICDEYAAKDPRVVVIHQKNSGAAAAKNAGLRVATGKYLSFVDSDDFLEPDAYSHMVGILQQQDADVVQCAYRDIFKDAVVERFSSAEWKDYSTTEYLQLYTKDWTCGLLWDKLYVRSIFDRVWFEEGHRIDDEYFTYQGIMNASKIVRDDRVIYNYRKRRSGVMYSPESARQIVLDRIDYMSKRRRNIIRRFPQLRRVFDTHFLEMLVILFRDPNRSEKSIRMVRDQIKLYFKEKDHSPADIHLWPALVKMYLGFVKPAESGLSNNTTDTTRYFD